MATASREFQIFTKPIGAICNLDCHYCYYLKKEQLYPNTKSFRMSDSVLEKYIAQHIEACPTEMIRFSWHGGEPTLLGLDFYRKVVAFQRKHQPAGKKISNGMQTNGMLLNEDWCRFFAQEEFSMGLSVDGPREMHDGYRVTKGQKPTHKQVMQGYKLLRKHKVSVDLLCVVHSENVQYPTAIYRFFKEIGAEYLSFLPIVERDRDAENGAGPHSVPAEAYGRFLCTVFDEWVRHDIGRIMIQIFDEATRPACGMEHSLCIFRETCGDFPVIEHNGDFYSCDHYVSPRYHLGNIQETPLVQMLEDKAQHEFGQAKRDTLPRYCRKCEVLDMCNGGCPKDRIIKTPHGENGLNYLCAGYKLFFNHSRPLLRKMASLWETGQPVENLMHLVRSEDAKIPPQAGRNDLCPCGSGKKYKRCCLGSVTA